jgi:2-aminoethylphosphonate-pyruvate transaminase
MQDKWLFTPGPLTTSITVKESMLHDYGSRDHQFVETVRFIRAELLRIASVSAPLWQCVLMQGSGTFGVESVISSAIPPKGKLLLLVNGAYGERMAAMAKVYGIDHEILSFNEDVSPDPASVEKMLSSGSFTHLAMVHSETTSGIFNELEPFGLLCKEYGISFIVDAMSSFGGVPIDIEKCNIDFIISSSNKCIEGVPGFSFILCRNNALKSCEGQARTLSLDLYAQWKGLEGNGQFRFTPPTHALLAFRRALEELEAEGGIEARYTRYRENNHILLQGMKALGFEAYLPAERQGCIINTFRFPAHPNFHFHTFYDELNRRNCVIYPGKLTREDCFRIGNIGRLYPEHMRVLLQAIAEVKHQMGF